MTGYQHKWITKQALGTALRPSAIRLVYKANQDSDLPPYFSVDRQHFCGSGDSSQAIANSKRFYRAVLNKIVELLQDETTPDQLNLSLYLFGRACHCLQDFYAHSNWIMLRNHGVWGGSSGGNIKVCESTKGAGALIIGACAWAGLYRKWDAEKSYQRIIGAGPSTHAEMNLDFPGTWADKLYKWKNRNASGYDEAKRLAAAHTRLEWRQFSRYIAANVGGDTLSDLWNHDPSRTRYHRSDLRARFIAMNMNTH
jgi:hypothetical protein